MERAATPASAPATPSSVAAAGAGASTGAALVSMGAASTLTGASALGIAAGCCWSCVVVVMMATVGRGRVWDGVEAGLEVVRRLPAKAGLLAAGLGCGRRPACRAVRGGW